MPTLLTVLGIVLFAVAILVSIALHEVGHLVPAKRFGVKVTQYMVGFGPTLWSRRRGETEYGVKWIPLGGYIRMIGMFPPRPGDDPRFLRGSSTGPFQAMVEDARRMSLEEVAPGDEDRVFHRLKARQKVVVMLGGPTVNLVLGVVLLAVALGGIGVQGIARTATIGGISECVQPATAPAAACTADDPAAPAAAAGLRPGDEVVSFGGREVGTWAALQDAIADAPPRRPVPVEVRRGGELLELEVTPIPNQRYADAERRRVETVSFLGVSPELVRTTVPLQDLPGEVWTAVSRTASAVVGIPQRMADVWSAAFSGQERDPEGPIGIVGVSRIGGEVAALEEPLWTKASAFVSLVASLNLALFVFNLIPLLPLDGGHVAGALWEGTRRHVARLRGRADPGPVDVARMLPVAYTVAILLIGMSGLLLYADLVNPVTLRG
ncbi:M50 family metallopeptidase [Vallicoccus soli]|uniref:RIP metalloprotease n=1 Tax=Vallicoccus soli TaxID=2339232 RepID=A0A3A3Z043_9ACTN|nr:site-2 protease family protein [Vallicoccus soli]RJK96503.1 RIP metalloprotease [Vallicoccus soli]